MTWQIPLFFNIIFGTVRSYLDKKLVDRIDPFLVFFYTSIWGTVFFLLFYFLRHLSFPTIYPEMIFLGVLITFAMCSYLAAIKISLSQSVIFTSYYLLLALILAAVFLSEWQLFNPTESSGQKTIVGGILAFISLFLLLSGGTKKEERLERKWLIYIVAFIILNAISVFWGKVFIADHGPLETLISQSLGALPAIYIINIIKKVKWPISRENHLLAAIDGLAVVLSVVFFYQSLKNGPLSLILPIQTLVGTMAVVLVGLFIYKETHMLTRQKTVGIVLGFLGVVLLVV